MAKKNENALNASEITEQDDVAVEVEVVDEVVEEAVEVVYEIPGSVRAGAGASYLSIALEFVSDEKAARDYAKKIQLLNNYAPVGYGTKVFLPRIGE